VYLVATRGETLLRVVRLLRIVHLSRIVATLLRIVTSLLGLLLESHRGRLTVAHLHLLRLWLRLRLRETDRDTSRHSRTHSHRHAVRTGADIHSNAAHMDRGTVGTRGHTHRGHTEIDSHAGSAADDNVSSVGGRVVMMLLHLDLRLRLRHRGTVAHLDTNSGTSRVGSALFVANATAGLAAGLEVDVSSLAGAKGTHATHSLTEGALVKGDATEEEALAVTQTAVALHGGGQTGFVSFCVRLRSCRGVNNVP
jgi:hypothetical protein